MTSFFFKFVITQERGLLSKIPETLFIFSRGGMILYKNQLDWIIVALEIGSNFFEKSFMVFVKIEKTIFFEREKSF